MEDKELIDEYLEIEDNDILVCNICGNSFLGTIVDAEYPICNRLDCYLKFRKTNY